MKKLILSVAMILITASVQAQTTVGSGTSTDTSNTPSGVGFDGALGGANSTTAPTNIPSNTIPRGNDFDTSLEQQRMEESTNPMGGSASGAAPTTTTPNSPSNTFDSVTPRAPSTPSNTTPQGRPFVPAATGVGPSAPTTY